MFMMKISLMVIGGSAIASALPAQKERPEALCPTVLMTLGRSPTSIARKANVVEVRSCYPGVLQLAAWGTHQGKPLVVETNRTSIVALATVVDRIYVVETAGASSNVVQAIVFEDGVPRLAINNAFKAYAEINISADTVVVAIRVPREAPQIFTFPTGIE